MSGVLIEDLASSRDLCGIGLLVCMGGRQVVVSEPTLAVETG